MKGLKSLLAAGNIVLAFAIAVPCLAQKINREIVFTARSDSQSSRTWNNGLQSKTSPASTIQQPNYGDPPFLVHATSDSPGVITYSLVSGNATVTSTGLVTLTGTGSVVVEAMQAETPAYTAATTTASFTVSPGTPTITFSVPNVSNTASFAVAASSTSTGSFTYSVVSGPARIQGDMVSLTGTGRVVLMASEAADANYKAASQTASFLSGAPALMVTANNASRLYGTQNPPFSGSVTGAIQSDIFLETFTTTATAASAPGTYPVNPVVSGPNLSNYAVDTVNGTLIIAQAPTLTTLSTSSTTISPDQTLSLTAQVTSTTTGVPSGSVTFFDNGTAFRTVPLVNGSASLVTSLTPGATHLLTASSSGDVNFLASAQSSAIGVTASPLDFAFTIQGETAQSSAPGKVASYTFSVSPLIGSFASPVTFSVLGLPNGVSALFTPSTLAPGSGSSVVQLYIQPAAETASQHRTVDPSSYRGVTLAMVVLLVLPGSRKVRQRLSGLFSAVLLIGLGLSGAVFLTGCGSGILQQGSGTYSLSVVATSGALQHTQSVTLKM